MTQKSNGRLPRTQFWLLGLSLTCLVVGVAMMMYSLLVLPNKVQPRPAAAPPAPQAAAPYVVQQECPPPPPPEPQEIVDRFHKFLFDNDVWQRMDFLGVRTLQFPTDMWVMQEIIFDVEPEFIIETGTFHGGSALYYATILEMMGGDGKVITIDIEPRVREASQYAVFRDRVEVITGSSSDPEVLARVRERVAGKRVLVTLDSDHSKAHVLAEIQGLAPLVSVGSYVVVQDTNLNGHPVALAYGPGPMEAVNTFMEGNEEFEIDARREKFFITFFPRGFLRRVNAPEAAEEGL